MKVSRLPLALALAAVALLSVTAANAPASGNQPTLAPVAKVRSKLTPADSRTGVDVKFAEGTDVRLRGNRLVSLSNGRIDALDDVLTRFPGLRVSRLFASTSEQELAASGREARAESGRPQADLNLYFRIQTPRGTETAALLDMLNALDIVESAAPQPKPAPLPVTPSYVSGQGYRTSASSGGGIDADYAHTLAGGKGENVTIVDVEYSWNRSHEDLSKARLVGSELKSGTPCDPQDPTREDHPTDHGTAVLGELVGDPNSFGVSGLVPNATMRTVNASRLNVNGACETNVADAINVAIQNTEPGDVILIEQQSFGPNNNNYVPVEWNSTVWSTIRRATDLKRIVIEAAGNGSQDLDGSSYTATTGLNYFSYDSGAIMVGAGNAPGCTYYGATPTRGRLYFSNYGNRLDVQGWGSCVTTTGYGKLQGGLDRNLWYTNVFGGTSSASPIVAAAAAILSSIAEQRGTTLTPAAVRSLLKSTGQAQQFVNANPGKIGPLPNLKAAIAAIVPTVTDAGHVVVEGSTLGATTVPVRQTWTSSGNATQYDVWLSTDGGQYVRQAPTTSTAVFNLERNHDYQFVARAKSADSVWGDYAYGTTFHLG